MSLVNAAKRLICRFEKTADFPVGERVAWAERQGLSAEKMLEIISQVRSRLEVELGALRRFEETSRATLIQQEYWCFYADQVKAYYQMTIRHRRCLHWGRDELQE